MRLKNNSGFSLAEIIVTTTLTAFSFVIFAATITSIQKASGIVNKSIESRSVSKIAKANIERALRSGYYFFESGDVALPKDSSGADIFPAIFDQNTLFKPLDNLPEDEEIEDGNQGNILYFLTQEMVPLREVVSPSITVSRTATVSVPANMDTKELSLVLSGDRLPSKLLDAKIRLLKLNILYLEKTDYDPNQPFSNNTYNLVQAVSNYKIFHRTDFNKSAEEEGSIIWAKQTILDENDHILEEIKNGIFKVPGNTEKSIKSYLNTNRKLIYRALDKAGIMGWDEPSEDTGSRPKIPVPLDINSASSYAKRILARNVGIKEVVGPKAIKLPDPTQNGNIMITIEPKIPISLQNKLGDLYDSPPEWYGISFNYINEKYTPKDSDDPDQGEEVDGIEVEGESDSKQKVSKIIEVALNISKYDSSSKKVVSTRNVFKVIPRNRLKRSL